MHLYKYRGNSDFTNKIFINQKVWLSNAIGLNDPFECSIQEIAKDWIKGEIKKDIKAHLSSFIMMASSCIQNNQNLYNFTPPQAQALLNTIKHKSNLKEKYHIFRKFIKDQTGHYPTSLHGTFSGFDKQLNEVGIFSLSETAENQLMWSHYAEQSKGIAIGFAVEENTKLSDTNHCLRVNYSDILPTFGDDGFKVITSFYFDEFRRPYPRKKISFEDPTFKLAITTKPTCWSYEQEWRYVEETAGDYSLPGPIKEIVFGLKCTPETREKYKALVKKYILNPVSFFEIQKVPNSNRIIKIHLKNI